MISAQEALIRLQEGNRRFVSNIGSQEMLLKQTRLDKLPLKQQPFAIVLGCSDARVPVEILFDQGLGELFVIRVAGNIVAPSIVGSIEFAASRFNTRLVVVLGHSQCGAIEATLEELLNPSINQSQNLLSIINRIRPAVDDLLLTDLRYDLDALVQHAIRANVGMSVNHLRKDSEILNQLIRYEDLMIVGAEYSLLTGAVNFID